MNVFLLFYLIGCGLVLAYMLTSLYFEGFNTFILNGYKKEYGKGWDIIGICTLIVLLNVAFSWLTAFHLLKPYLLNLLETYKNRKNQKNSD